jgi:lactoylglutathione lyase
LTSQRSRSIAAITNAHHVGLTVRSLERSLRFYRDAFGFEIVFQWNPQAAYIRELVGCPTVDLHAVVLRIPGSDVFLELMEYREVDAEAIDPMTARAGVAHIAFAVDDLDSLYESLVAQGHSSVSRPVTPTIGPNRGGRAVYLLDPDGIRVELIQSARRFDEYVPSAEGV